MPKEPSEINHIMTVEAGPSIALSCLQIKRGGGSARSNYLQIQLRYWTFKGDDYEIRLLLCEIIADYKLQIVNLQV